MSKSQDVLVSSAIAVTNLGCQVVPTVMVPTDGGKWRKEPHRALAPHGYHSATDDGLVIASWMDRRSPPNSFGVVCGGKSGWVVIDLDGETAPAQLAQLEKQYEKLPACPVAKTGHGWHYYFRLPPGVRLGRKIRLVGEIGGDGIDLLADGMVIAPPAPDGRHWIIPLPAISEDIPLLPNWLMRLCSAGQGKRHQNYQITTTSPAQAGERVHMVLDALRRLNRDIELHSTYWLAQCPAHPDRTPSLSITARNKRGVGLHCFAGCSRDAILTALGLDFAAPARPAERPPLRAVSASTPDNAEALAVTRDELQGADITRTVRQLWAAPPGAGKTTALAAAAAAVVADGGAALIVTQTVAAVSAHINLLAAAGVDGTSHAPRVCPTEGEIERREPLVGRATCWEMDAIDTAGEDNHIPAASVCHQCPHYWRAAIATAATDMRQSEIRANASIWQSRRPDTPHWQDVPLCGYFLCLPADRIAPALVTTAAGLSDEMRYVGAGEERREREITAYDETPALLHIVSVDVADVDEWRAAVTDLITKKQGAADKWRDSIPEMAAKHAADAATMTKVRTCLTDLEIAISRSDEDELKRALEALSGLSSSGALGSAAEWERVWLSWDGLSDVASVETTLRALSELTWAVKYGGYQMRAPEVDCHQRPHPARIEYSAPTAAGQMIATQSRWLIADATPPQVIRDLVEPADTLTANTRIHIYHDDWCHWTAGIRQDTKTIEQQARKIIAVARRTARPEHKTALLVRQALHEVIIQKEWWPSELVGHFGLDDRAHNRWAGCDLFIFGESRPTRNDEALLYRGDHAFMRYATGDTDAWADYDQELWELDRLGRERMQAIGRARLLDHSDARVVIFGRTGNLAPYGVDVIPVTGSSVQERVKAEQRLVRVAQLERVGAAWRSLERRGVQPTNTHLRAELRATDTGGVANDVACEWRRTMRAAGSSAAAVARLQRERDEITAWTGVRPELRPSTTSRGQIRMRVVMVILASWGEVPPAPPSRRTVEMARSFSGRRAAHSRAP